VRTGHPYNVNINNVRIDALRGYGVSATGVVTNLSNLNSCFDLCGNWGIWLSGVYNTKITGLKAKEVGTAITIYAGDYGGTFAAPYQKNSVGQNIVIDGVNIDKATIRGININGEPQLKAHTFQPNVSPLVEIPSMPVRMSNIILNGSNISNPGKNGAYLAGGGLLITDNVGSTVSNTSIYNFSNGVEIYDGVKDLTLTNLTIDSMQHSGFITTSSVDTPSNITIDGCIIRDVDLANRGEDFDSSIYAGAVLGFKIKNCEINPLQSDPQKYGVRIVDYGIDSNVQIENTRVNRLGAGGVAYSVRSGSRQNFVWTLINSVSTSPIINVEGVAPAMQ
jgi:hypothetical protein